MSPVYLLPFFVLGIQSKYMNSTICDGVNANFNMTSVAGTWYVASVMAKPETDFDPKTIVPCYKVEFVDIKKDDLPQATKQSLKYEIPMNMVEYKGSLIRQKFSSERPVAIIWSISTSGFNGCYQQIQAFDMERSFLTQAVTHSPAMQLHLIDGDLKRDITDPILLQILWEETMIAVIYRRQMEYDSDDLVDTVLEAMEDFRKGLTFPYSSYCDELFKNIKQK